MNDESFRRVLRAAFAMTMTSPIVATVIACGGSTSGGSSAPDASTTTSGGPAPTTTSSTSTGPGSADAAADASPDASPPDAGTCKPAKMPDDAACTLYRQIPCANRAAAKDAGGADPAVCALCRDDGGLGFGVCGVERDTADTPYVTCTSCVIGRRPEGLGATRPASGDAVGRYFAAVSQLEAASVDAFLNLRAELGERDAPADLVARAGRSAGDEVRHAKAMADLALAFGADDGGWKGPPEVEPRRARSDEAVAIENAVEGQVRETFGALVAIWQSEHAREPSIRAAMQTVAEDETRHAALSWAVDAWACERLDEPARARVRAARQRALMTLRQEIATSPSQELVDQAGLPSAADAERLFVALEALLWRPIDRVS